MRVFAIEAVGQLVGMGLADHVRTGVEQTLHRRRGGARHAVRRQPVGAAEAGLVAGDIVNVLGAEGESRERAARGSGKLNVGVAAESAEGIAIENAGHAGFYRARGDRAAAGF